MVDLVRIEEPAQDVGMVLLDNPPKNFGSYALLQALHDGIREVRARGAKVIILASDVPGYLMAHAWLPDVINAYEDPGSITGNPLLWRMVAHELERGDMISISCNQGQAWGGGAELSWACNLRTASESATYAQIESILGVVPGGGGTARLARLVGQSKALEILLAAEPFTARQLEALGLVNKVFGDDEARARTIEWAAMIATRPKRALMACKRGVLQTWDLDMENALRLEGYIFNSCMRPETLDTLRHIQAGYDAGQDSWDVYGISRTGVLASDEQVEQDDDA